MGIRVGYEPVGAIGQSALAGGYGQYKLQQQARADKLAMFLQQMAQQQAELSARKDSEAARLEANKESEALRLGAQKESEALRLAAEKEQLGWRAGESEKERVWRSGESKADRDWKEGNEQAQMEGELAGLKGSFAVPQEAKPVIWNPDAPPQGPGDFRVGTSEIDPESGQQISVPEFVPDNSETQKFRRQYSQNQLRQLEGLDAREQEVYNELAKVPKGTEGYQKALRRAHAARLQLDRQRRAIQPMSIVQDTRAEDPAKLASEERKAKATEQKTIATLTAKLMAETHLGPGGKEVPNYTPQQARKLAEKILSGQFDDAGEAEAQAILARANASAPANAGEAQAQVPLEVERKQFYDDLNARRMAAGLPPVGPYLTQRRDAIKASIEQWAQQGMTREQIKARLVGALNGR